MVDDVREEVARRGVPAGDLCDVAADHENVRHPGVRDLVEQPVHVVAVAHHPGRDVGSHVMAERP